MNPLRVMLKREKMKPVKKNDRNQMIMSHFSPENSWEENYKKIIELGKKLEKFEDKDREDKWLIRACQSPLWLKVEKNERGELIFTGDSEALITKGILAIIVEFYTKRTAEEIIKENPVFIEKLKLTQFLSARRSNGIQALLDQIQQYAKAFLILSHSEQ